MPWPNDVRKSDLRIDTYRGSGPGGQHRNKTDSAVRITHLPTGLVGSSENHRSQHQNRAEAFRRLAEKLVPLMRQALTRPEAERVHDRVRTYHLPDRRVTDHRVPGRRWDPERVLEGELQDLIETLVLEHARE
jgi:peptide chain release factor 1